MTQSAITMSSSFSFLYPKSIPNQDLSLPIFKSNSSSTPFLKSGRNYFTIKASSSSSTPNPIISTVKTTAAAVIFAAAVYGTFHKFPARANSPPPPPPTLTEEFQGKIEETPDLINKKNPTTPLTQFLESSEEAVEALEALLKQKLEAHEDEESLKILKKLSAAQPENTEWKFLMARLLNEMGNVEEARETFEEILSKKPLSFEALFENALLMDKCGEGEAVIKRLEDALKIAEEGKKAKEARDIRLIMAQVQFLQKNVDEALRSYEELEKEDPKDFRPYFCKGMIYSLLDRNEEARNQFAKSRQLSPAKFDVEGYLRTPLSRMKLFGTNEEN